jgi:hypothetical protein
VYCSIVITPEPTSHDLPAPNSEKKTQELDFDFEDNALLPTHSYLLLMDEEDKIFQCLVGDPSPVQVLCHHPL